MSKKENVFNRFGLLFVAIVAVIGIFLLFSISSSFSDGSSSLTGKAVDFSGRLHGLKKVAPSNTVITTQGSISSPLCSDSDGGIDFSVKGTTVGRTQSSHTIGTYTDHCAGGGSETYDGWMVEYYCSGNIAWPYYKSCPRFSECVDGICQSGLSAVSS